MSGVRNGDRPRALFICSKLPYPNTHGLPLRQATQIEALALDYEVTVAARAAPTTRSVTIADGVEVQVEPWGPYSTAPSSAPPGKPGLDKAFGTLRLDQVLNGYLSRPATLFDPVPPILQNTRRARFQACLQSGRFDLVWVSRLEMAWVIGPIGPLPGVLDLDDLESSAYQSKRELKADLSADDVSRLSQKVAEISRVERELSRAYQLVTLASAQEVEKVGLSNARVLQNCAPANGVPQSSRTDRAGHILFIGFLEYLPNLHGVCWFLEKVWPALSHARPTTLLDVVGECFNGGRPPSFRAPSNVRFHGFVEDPASFWESAAVLIVPVFAGGGTRIKILEAWSRGVPVVSTSLGVAGLEAVDGVHALIADTPEAFAQKCEAVLSSPALRRTLAAAGKDLVRSKYSHAQVSASIRRIAQEARDRVASPPVL